MRNVFQPAAMDRALAVLERYAAECRNTGVGQIMAVGTAAFRCVTNGEAFCRRVREQCGLTIDVISGKREAELADRAAATDFGRDLLVCDIGGGSTEFIWRSTNQSQITALSLPLGSVVLHEGHCHTDPISDVEFGQTQMAIRSELMTHLGSGHRGGAGLRNDRRPGTLVALAGTATTLAAMHRRLRTYRHGEVHGTLLTAADIQAILVDLRARTVAERQQLPGLEPGRADVILPGALILAETMQLLGYEQVTISDRGVRWGLIYEALESPPRKRLASPVAK